MAREKKPLWERPTFVYRFFAGDALLYVGISDQWTTRCEQHRNSAAWYRMATSLLVEEYADRHQAFAAESWAIAYERPAYNTEAQWKSCPFIPPVAIATFGRRITHRDFHGVELTPIAYVEERVSYAS